MTVYFYTPQLDFFNQIRSEKDLIPHTANGLGCWIHQAAFYLGKYSTSITPVVVDHIPDQGVIIFHKGFFPKTVKPGKSQYFVCVPADYGRHRFAHMHIVQNVDQIANASVSRQSIADKLFRFAGSYFIPLWLQPELKARSEERKSLIQTVSFFGNPEQFPEAEIETIKRGLEERNMQLQLKLQPAAWTDYSDTDITLALRSFGIKPYYNKPISKMVNAALCNSLIIAGNESSSWYFQKKYYPELPVISTTKELLAAVDKLRAHPEMAFEKLAEAKERLAEINTVSLVREWEKLLTIASENFQRWQSLHSISRKLFIRLRSI